MKHGAQVDMTVAIDSGLPIEKLKEFGLASVDVPEGFPLHNRIEKTHVKARTEMVRCNVNQKS